MTKTVRNIAFALLFTTFCSVSIGSRAQDVQKAPIEQEQTAVTIKVSQSTIHVKNAEGAVLEIFSITGQKIYTIRLDSSSKIIELENLSRGCYIARVGKTTCKFYIK